MNYTTHYKLQKDLTIEKYDVNVVNMNSDIIDSALHRLDLKDKSQDELLATKESLNSEITRATTKEDNIIEDLASEIARAKSSENSNTNAITNEVARAIMAEQNISTTLSAHNISESSHSDMRLLISGLTTRLNTLANSDDTTLDQLSEIVAYIKNNKELIDGITSSKVNVSDIIDDLTTNSGDKVLSAKQGTVLKGLITDLTVSIPTKISQLENDSGYKTTDNNTWRGIQNNLTSTSTTESLSAAQGKLLDERKVNKSGDSMTGVLNVCQGTNVFQENGSRLDGYVKLATLKILTSYTNMPITLELARRAAKTTSCIYIAFKNENSSDPEIQSFVYTGTDYNVYIHKSATSTWDLYCQRAESADHINVVRFHKTVFNSGISVDWKSEAIGSTLPSGSIKAQLVEQAGGGIIYSDSQPSSNLLLGMTWIGS